MSHKILKTLVSVFLVIFAITSWTPAIAQLEDRTPTGGANITTRKCVGGANAGTLCNNDSDCDSGDCFDYNIFDLTINFRLPTGGGWTPTAAQMTAIQGYFTAINNTIADVTDGQMSLGTVTLVVDNGAPNAVVQLLAGTCDTPGGGVCLTDADCPVGIDCDGGGGSTNTGDWGAHGKITIGPYCLQNPLCFAHEFMHLVANVRDEYEGALDDNVDNDGDGEIDECGENQSKWRCFGGTNDGAPCNLFCIGGTNSGLACSSDADCPGGMCPAVGVINCGGGGNCRRIVCIDPGTAAVPGCLMRCCLNNTGTELCWSGNHDPDLHTEQSQCRNNNDCWTQLGEEWPSVIEVPPGAPDPGPATAPTTVGFLTPSALGRFVAVIDRSGSMDEEAPRRIDVAVTAMKDFVDLLSDGTEFGLASFASVHAQADPPDVASTKDFPSALGLRALNTNTDRTDAKNAIDGLSGRTGGRTQIGAGLLQALDMLLEAGGTITLNTSVMLLTDGLNNEPISDPDADLDAALDQLADDGIPVFVSCIGEARDSTQCSYIADQTSGRYVDSAETESLYDAFVEFAVEAQAKEISHSDIGIPISEGDISEYISALIEAGVESARFIVTWTKPSSNLELSLFRPDWTQVDVTHKIVANQGESYLITSPTAGIWRMKVHGASIPDPPEKFSARSIVENKELNVEAGLHKSTIQWPEVFLISANASMGLSITGCSVSVKVEMSGGSSEVFQLKDDGSGGDTREYDGLYQGEFRNFIDGDGIYTFTVYVDCQNPRFFQDSEPGIGPFPVEPDIGCFQRTIRFSGTITGVPDNLPPVARICQDKKAECLGMTTPVDLDGTCSSDPEGEELLYSWGSPTGYIPDTTATPTGNFPLGRNDITLVVTDPHEAESAPDDGLVIIEDTTPPDITCPADATVECDQPTDPSNTGQPTVTDICDSTPDIVYSDAQAPGDCPQEETITRTWTATDSVGNSSSCTQVISVVDTTPPVISCNAPAVITPPDAPISFTSTATDNCDAAPSVEIIGFDCFMLTQKGKRIDKKDSCVVEIAGDTITIIDTGGVGDHIIWTSRSIDSCDNVAEKVCEVEVVNPGLP